MPRGTIDRPTDPTHPPNDTARHSTGVVLLKKIAEELAYPTMTCPISGRPFSKASTVSGVVTAGAHTRAPHGSAA